MNHALYLRARNYKSRAVFALVAMMLLASYSFGKDKPKENVVSLRGAIMDSQ